MNDGIKYLIAHEQDVSWGLVINTTGYQSIAPNSLYPSTNHPTRYLFSTEEGRILNEYQLIYIINGEGFFTSTHQRKTEIKSGDMILLFPGEWHTYSPSKETGWYECWIGFDGNDMDSKVKANFFDKQKPVFHVGVHENIISLFKLAVKTAKEQKSGFQQMLAGIVNLLLGFTYSENKQLLFEDLKVSEQINRAKYIMHENVSSNISGKEVARKVEMGYSWFRTIFKSYVGLSPTQYMLELRINKSKELLTNTLMTCQEIALELSFETPAYFNSTFKKRTGTTPIEYRKVTQGKKT